MITKVSETPHDEDWMSYANWFTTKHVQPARTQPMKSGDELNVNRSTTNAYSARICCALAIAIGAVVSEESLTNWP